MRFCILVFLLFGIVFAQRPPVSAPVDWVLGHLTNGDEKRNSALYVSPTDWFFLNTCISDTSYGNHQGEVDITVSPIEDGRLVAVWHNFRPISDWYYTIDFEYALTTDNGDTWENHTLHHPRYPDTLFFLGDPTVAVDHSGNFYIAAIGFNSDFTESAIFVFTSRDGGDTFTELCTLVIDNDYYFHDKEWIEADWAGAFPGNVYVVWQRFGGYWEDVDIMFSRSTDYGHSYEPPVVIASGVGLASPGIPYCAVGPDGEFYISGVVWSAAPIQQVKCVRSDDGGVSFSEPFSVVSTEIIADSLGRFHRANGFPVIAVDAFSAEHRGDVYIAYASWEGFVRRADVFCVRSTDRGLTWSEPVLVNDVTDGDQFMPWVDIAPNGNVNIIFYDTRDNLSTGWCDVYFAQSTDGGNSFLPNLRITTESFDPAEQFMGDYINIDFSNDRLFPIWTDTRLGLEHIFVGVGEETAINFAASSEDKLPSVYPNPFNEVCHITIPKGFAMGNRLQILDSSGKIIRDFVIEQDEQEFTLNSAELQSGLYFVRISGKQSFQKLVLIK